MHAPLYSTITLIAELFISAAIYFTLYKGYTRNVFPVKVAGIALAYEILFNISYMVFRVVTHPESQPEPLFDVALAIIHGSLSLVMFIALIIFFALAWKNYRKGINYFRAHKTVTILFTIFWTLSVVSGILFYFVDYFIYT